MPQGWDLGVLGSKTLAWRFAMAPHRMYNLVFNFFPKVLVFHDVIIVYVGIYVAFEEVTIQ